jgi:WD40 repeat protein
VKRLAFPTVFLVICLSVSDRQSLFAQGQRPNSTASDKSGTIKIVPDPAFGTKTEWDTLFGTSSMGPAPPTVKWTAFLPDGSFFRAATADGLVHKFDALGNLIKTFGHKGQGPGDLQNPAALDLLDAKILVVNDAGNRRLSLFDLDGNFLRTVKLGKGGSSTSSILTLAALAGNKIAAPFMKGGRVLRTLSPPAIVF